MAHLFLVPTSSDTAHAYPQAEAPTDDDLTLVPVRLLLAFGGRCSCDDCCRAWVAGDRSAGIVEVGAPRLRLVAP